MTVKMGLMQTMGWPEYQRGCTDQGLAQVGSKDVGMHMQFACRRIFSINLLEKQAANNGRVTDVSSKPWSKEQRYSMHRCTHLLTTASHTTRLWLSNANLRFFKKSIYQNFLQNHFHYQHTQVPHHYLAWLVVEVKRLLNKQEQQTAAQQQPAKHNTFIGGKSSLERTVQNCEVPKVVEGSTKTRIEQKKYIKYTIASRKEHEFYHLIRKKSISEV